MRGGRGKEKSRVFRERGRGLVKRRRR